MCRGCIQSIRKIDESYLPQVQARECQDLQMLFKLNNRIFFIKEQEHYYIIDSETLQPIRKLSELGGERIAGVQMIKNKLIIITNMRSAFYQIEDYDLKLLMNFNTVYEKIVNVPFKNKIALCRSSIDCQTYFFDIFQINDGNIQMRTTSQTKEPIMLSSICALKKKGYYLYSDSDHYKVSKFKFERTLKIKQVKVIISDELFDQRVDTFQQRSLKDYLIIHYRTAEDSIINRFIDLKKSLYRQQQSFDNSLLYDQHYNALPDFDMKTKPYLAFNNKTRMYLLNYANRELIYHMMDYHKSFIIQKSNQSLKKYTIINEYWLLQEIQNSTIGDLQSRENELEDVKHKQVVSDLQRGLVSTRMSPLIDYKSNSLYGNYDLITMFRRNKLSRFRMQLPDIIQ